MRDIFTLFLHAIVTIIRFGQPGGLRSVVAESVLMRHQVLILNRGRKRAPNLRASDRIIAGLCTLLMRPARVLRSAVALKTSTLLHFHKMLIKHKYRLLFSPKRVRRPGPKGPTKELIDAVVEMKRRNCSWGCKRIAQQIALAFGVDIDKDVVRRILAIHFHPEAGSGGPSWLSFIGHAKDSLWSLDLFRCESAILRTYWVLVVMDRCTRRIVGLVPTANAGEVGLRKIVERRDVEEVLSFLGSNQFFTQKDWKDRFKENSEKMRSGSIFHVAEVFKNLVYLSRVKPLSFREKRMLDRARFLLISELSTVMNQAELEIEDRIEKAVTKACGKVPVA